MSFFSNYNNNAQKLNFKNEDTNIVKSANFSLSLIFYPVIVLMTLQDFLYISKNIL